MCGHGCSNVSSTKKYKKKGGGGNVGRGCGGGGGEGAVQAITASVKI